MQKTPFYKRCLWLLVALCLTALPALSLAADYAVVSGGSLNLRQEASLDSKVLAQYPTGTWMTIEEQGSDWSKVTVAGKEGYVMSKYLKDSADTSKLFVRTNTGIGLNLRSAPALTGDILASFKPGTEVTVLLRGADWYKVQAEGQTGFMASRYLAKAATSGSTGSVTGYPKTGVVSNPGANQVLLLREEASTDARVLGYYGNGVTVKLLGESGSFYKVTVDSKNGYMMKKFVKVTASTVVETPFAAKLVNPNGNSIVNFRKAGNLSASIIKAYPVGTEISVLEVGEYWSKVQIEGTEGYVSNFFYKAQ